MRYKFKVGDEILTSYPFVHVILPSHRGIVCDHCLKRSETLLRCSKCKIAHFCSRNCQVAAWPDHKVECCRLREASPTEPYSAVADVRFFGKILIKLKGKDPKKLTEDVLGQKRSFHDLMSHVDRIKKDAQRMREFRLLWDAIAKFLGEKWLPPVEAGLEIFGKRCINSYTISDGEGNYAIGLYIGPSALDHSCDPNAQYVFDGHKLVLRAIKDIACDSLDGIRITYVDLLDLRKERVAKLRQRFFFECDCTRCKADEEYLTEKSPVLTSKVMALCNAIPGASSKEDYTRLLKAAEDFIAENELPENDTARAKARKLAIFCAVRGSIFKMALPHFFASVEVFRKCYGPFHTTYSRLLFNLAAALQYNGRLEDAVKYYGEASDAMEVSHGQGHPRYQMFHEARLRCEKQMLVTKNTQAHANMS